MGTELPTEGPFARLSTRTCAPDEPTTSKPATSHSSASTTVRQHAKTLEPGHSAVRTHHLEFCYPGIGARPLLNS